MCQQPPRITDKMIKETILCGTQNDFLPSCNHFMPGEINPKIRINNDLHFPRWCSHERTTQERTNTREQFPWIKWFCDVIISTEIEAMYFILVILPHSEHNYRNIRYLTNMSQCLESIHFRHHDIYDDQIRQVFT